MSHKEENNKNKVGMEESKDLIKIKIYIGKMCGFHGLDFRQNKKSTQKKVVSQLILKIDLWLFIFACQNGFKKNINFL